MLLKILLLLLGAILTITIYACVVAGKRADEVSKSREVKDLMSDEEMENFRKMLREINEKEEQERLRRKKVSRMPKKIEVSDRKYYVVLDKIHLVYEDDKLVGWYNPTQEVE